MDLFVKKQTFWKELATDLGYDLVGTAIYALGLHVFVIPANFAPGGVSGLAAMLNYLFHFPVGTGILLLNLPLLLAAFKFLGKCFTFKTLKTILIITLMTDVIVTPLPYYKGNPLLAALFGGLLMGVGLALVFMRGSTTGGSDIAGRLLQLAMPQLPIGRAMMVMDFMVVCISILVYGNLEAGLYALISIFTCNYTLDTVLYGMDKGKLTWVFSMKNDEIAQDILQHMGRGATFLKSHGAFSRAEREVLVCAVRRNEYHKLKKIVMTRDPAAFMICTDATEVLGEGFRPIDKQN